MRWRRWMLAVAVLTSTSTHRRHASDGHAVAGPPKRVRGDVWHISEETDNDWYQMHAAAMHASAIRIPYMQQNNW